VGWVLLWIWLPGTLIVISLLMAGHLLTLPKPILNAKQVSARGLPPDALAPD